MCKKLMFLVSFVCLLVLSLPVSAADLEVDWPDVYVVSGVEEYGDMSISGKVIIPAGAELIMNDESELNGNGDDGCGGDGASIIVDGGTFTMHNRLNMGKGDDAYLIVDNGGVVAHDGDKITVPDDGGGQHRVIVLDGTMTCEEIEIIPDRDAAVVLGCNVYFETCNTDEDGGESRNPAWWLTQDISGGCGSGKALQCDAGCSGILTVTDLGGNCASATCLLIGPEAFKPSPSDDAINEAALTCDMILEWDEGNCLLPGRGVNVLYFSDDCDIVENQVSPPDAGWDTAAPAGSFVAMIDRLDPRGRQTYNIGTLALWTEYCWRVDQGCDDGSVVRGDVWSFSTGCVLDGDTNMDCVVNFLDYAAVASTWMDEQFFPEGCTP